jgi:hypothetical protein
MAGNAAGTLIPVAHRLGLTVDEYLAHKEAGLKWCSGCKDWHPTEDFFRDRRRADGLGPECRRFKRSHTATRVRSKRVYDAHNAVRRAVAKGVLLPPNLLACVDCGHVWIENERRHEYDHYLGYDKENWLDVQSVCTTCHADREKVRRNNASIS